MKIRVITGVLVTTVFAIGAGDCFAQNVKAVAKDNGSKSAPIYNSINGHYYEFVGEKELTWPQAKQRAESRVLIIGGKQLRGYLVTLTSQDEQELLAKHYLDPPDVHTDVWMGGNDDKVDDEWRWVTGPEAKADGGKGKLFFKGRDAIGYTNWLGREPNKSGGVESFLQWNHVPSPRIPPGKWNDQPIDKPGSKGYFVEYGGAVDGQSKPRPKD